MLQLTKKHKKILSLMLVFSMLFSLLLSGCGAKGEEQEIEKTETIEEETIQTYVLTYMLDGEVYEEQNYEEGAKIEAPTPEDRENFVFSGWVDLPETMPAEDLTVEGAYEFDGTLVTDLENVYECNLVMGEGMSMMLYLRVDEEGNFVFSRSTDFSATDKGAGKIYEREEGAYYMVYHVVDGETVVPGNNIATFEVTEDGEIQFTSVMWFGATAPVITAEDGTETYLLFVISDEEMIADLNKDAIGGNTDQGEEEESTDAPAEDDATAGSTTGYKTGTYGGKHSTVAMGNNLTYAYRLTLNANNTYTYKVSFVMMGTTYNESESGTYQVSGSSLTLTSSDGTTMNGTINGNSATLTRYVSSFAFSPVTISLTYGYTPSAGGSGNSGSSSSSGNSGSDSGTTSQGSSNNSSNTGNNSSGSGNNNSGSSNNSGGVKDTTVNTGTYAVDISWSPMGAMMSPVLEIDADAMTFDIYNASQAGTSKGSGTITEKNGVYTLNYENGNTTTFTFENGVITFTSKLWYGTASFDNTDANGKFISYTATQTSGSTDEIPDEMPDDSGSNVTPDDSDNSDAPSEEETVAYKTGTYGGSYTNVSSSGKETAYVYTLTLNEDDSYIYTASFAMGTDIYTQTENGTYTVNGSILTLTSSDLIVTNSSGETVTSKNTSEIMTGTINAEGSATVTRYVSFFAAMSGKQAELILTYGEMPNLGDETVAYKTGTYGGTYTNVSSSGKETEYVYTLTLNEDGTYVYTASFAMGGGTYTQTENGTYTVSEGVLTLTSDGLVVKDTEGNEVLSNETATEMTGTINAEGNATVTRYVSYFAAMSGAQAELNLIHGYTPSLDGGSEDSGSTGTEDDTTAEESVAYKTGTYGGTYTTVAKGSEVVYVYTLALNEDKTYTYTVNFTMMGDRTQNETGTYEVTDGTLTLTSSDGVVMNGTIDSDGNATLSRKVSTFASANVDLILLYGYTPAAETETRSEEVVEANTVATDTTPAVAEVSETTEESGKDSVVTGELVTEDEYVVVEVPAVEEKSEIAEESAAVEEAVAEYESVVEEANIAETAPVIAEEPIAEDEPVIEEKAVVVAETEKAEPASAPESKDDEETETMG